MRVFVTGATGFLGINLIHTLARQGHEIHAIYRNSASIDALSHLNVHWYKGDILDELSLAKACPEGIDWFFHLAADTSMWSQLNDQQTKINVQGTANVLACAVKKKVKRFIHTSSIAAYGIHHGQCISESSEQLGGQSFANYYRSKFEAECLVKQTVVNEGLQAVILNPCHLLGAWDSHNWSQMITMVANEVLPAVPPGRGSFCHIQAVADAHIAAAERGRVGENYILSGIDATFEEFIQTIAVVVGKPVSKKPLPAWLLRLAAQVMNIVSFITRKEPDLTPEKILIICDEMLVSSEKAQRELDYVANIPLEQMIRDSYEWLSSPESSKEAPSPSQAVVNGH